MKISELPPYLHQNNRKYFLTISKAIDNTWCGAYLHMNEDGTYQVLDNLAFNDATTLSEVALRMNGKLHRRNMINKSSKQED